MFDIKNAMEAAKAAKEAAEAAPNFVFAYRDENESDAAELYILQQIGEDFFSEGVQSQDVINFLNNNRERDVRVVINSPGGLVYEGLAIYNALKSHAGFVRVEIVGQAYSAASFIAMAGDHIAIHEAADIGIHLAHGMYAGNQYGFHAIGDYLETIDEHLTGIYEARTGQSREDIRAQLLGKDQGVTGSVMRASQALELGYVDEIIANKHKKKKYAKKANAVAKKRIAAQHALQILKLKERCA